jgi:hypothetical protein
MAGADQIVIKKIRARHVGDTTADAQIFLCRNAIKDYSSGL